MNHGKKNYVPNNFLLVKINLKRTALCLLQETESWYWLSTLVTKQRVYTNPGLDLHQVQDKNEITTKFIQNRGHISLASCCSKILKCGIPDFRTTCFSNFKNWEGSIIDLEDFKRDIIFTKKDTKGDRILKTVLKLDQNCTILLRHWRAALI